MEKNKELSFRDKLIGIILFIIFSFFLFTALSSFFHTPYRSDIIKTTKNEFTLIENVDNNIQKIANQDKLDYYITHFPSMGVENIYVYCFKNEEDKEKVVDFKQSSISGTYVFINNQWYIKNTSKQYISKETAIDEINQILNGINMSIIDKKEIEKSWGKK